MNKLVFIALPMVLAGLLLLSSNYRTEAHRKVRLSSGTTPAGATRTTFESRSIQQDRPTPPATPTTTTPDHQPLTKADRIERIVDDYDQITIAALAGLGALDRKKAGPSPGLLKQLAFIEHARRRDLASVLTSRELEDLELKETKAGRLVNQLLGDTNASEEQRRAVFRLQREFELQFNQTFNSTPLTYLEREYVRQQTQEKIRAALGEELFGVWLAGADELHPKATAFASDHGVSPRIADELRQTRDDYRLATLALHATRELPEHELRAAQRQLTEEIEARVVTILGPALYQAARSELLNWLPRG
jgi:hypothetical protein